ncbi:glutathione S-transferase [Leisingera sp. ANG59]|uniref:glutathione S-transferase n=1 Tax=Leisingera sp. ANG59 TaxID=2675221 RepID=UPI001574D553|nr:glutathione S-transferase [Leisingera sp. ANG59]NSY41369.1 glutathione S-transferase [Leisingera sp. ANG59]
MSARYQLYYWPIPFRGHFIRYVLAYAGQEWEEPGFDAVAELKNRGVADQPHPFMAPPLLADTRTGTHLSQMPAILMALGREYELLTEPEQTLRLICDASDILFEITRYHGALMWDAESWVDFHGNRLPRWMQIHERIVVEAGVSAGKGCLWGRDRPGLADLVLGALWHTMIDRLPPLRLLLHNNAPVLEGLAGRIAAEPPIAALINDWAAHEPKYCAGQIEASLLNMLNMETKT